MTFGNSSKLEACSWANAGKQRSILDCQPPGIWAINFCYLWAPSLWYFVIASQTDEDMHCKNYQAYFLHSDFPYFSCLAFQCFIFTFSWLCSSALCITHVQTCTPACVKPMSWYLWLVAGVSLQNHRAWSLNTQKGFPYHEPRYSLDLEPWGQKAKILILLQPLTG